MVFILFKINILFNLFIYIIFLTIVNASITDYFKNIGNYFGYKSEGIDDANGIEYQQKIPYEVSIADEKFISEAAKLTGVALSELDWCQQKVVLKLKNDCNKMNDEELAKMGVHLLNCQSFAEGRKVYTCTENMSIKDCTIYMDSDTWTSYHLMSNRAKAVCYTIRQSQFRGLAEYTVNKLMKATQDQLSALGKIANDQENIQNLAQDTLNTVAKGHEQLISQQKDFHSAQLHGQLTLEDNIRRLVDEKRLISETYQQLASMSQLLQGKLEKASKQMENQAGESRNNHQELIDDLMIIQNKINVIFQRIEDSSDRLLKQSELAKQQFELTVKQLAEVNSTVHGLVSLVTNTKLAIDERLSWITTAMGGTDLAVERLYLISWHIAFLFIAMVASAFLSARMSTRLIITIFPLANLALSINNADDSLGPINMLISLSLLILVPAIIEYSLSLWNYKIYTRILPSLKSNISKENLNQTPEVHSSINDNLGSNYETIETRSTTSKREFDDSVDFNEFGSPTPPLSRSGYYLSSRSRSRTPNLYLNGLSKGHCHAKTRVGTPCKLIALAGRDYCYKHQSGDSVMAT